MMDISDFKLTIAVWGMALMAFTAPAFAQKWTDRGEYDLALAIRAEGLAAKRLALLDEWKAKYPKTELREARWDLYLAEHQTAGAWTRMLQVASEIAAEAPDNLSGLYWTTLLAPTAKEPSPGILKTAEFAARRLATESAALFTAGRKPPSLTEAEWQQRRYEAEYLGCRALGWFAWQKGELETAEQALMKCLQSNPKQAELSAWLGMVLMLQKNEAKQVASFWHLARASAAEGQAGLPDAQRAGIRTLLDRSYAVYHGSAEGLDQLTKNALAQSMPPADFAVESAAVLAERKRQQEFKEANPELTLWLDLKKMLLAENGEAYFEQSLKATAVPKLKGTLIRYSPAARPKELVFGLAEPGVEEVVLQLDAPLAKAPEAGTVYFFEGLGVAFTKSPFLVTLRVENANLSVAPAPAK